MLTLLTVVTGPDDPITQPTNRGNKLKTNATHVREGALGYINSEELYKKVDLLHLPPKTHFFRRTDPLKERKRGRRKLEIKLTDNYFFFSCY